jgi:hypothetical protein
MPPDPRSPARTRTGTTGCKESGWCGRQRARTGPGLATARPPDRGPEHSGTAGTPAAPGSSPSQDARSLPSRWKCGGYPTGPSPNASADKCRGCRHAGSPPHRTRAVLPRSARYTRGSSATSRSRQRTSRSPSPPRSSRSLFFDAPGGGLTLGKLKDALAAFIVGLERYAAATAELDDRHPGLALDHGLAIHRASLRWTRHAIAALRAAPAPW